MHTCRFATFMLSWAIYFNRFWVKVVQQLYAKMGTLIHILWNSWKTCFFFVFNILDTCQWSVRILNMFNFESSKLLWCSMFGSPHGSSGNQAPEPSQGSWIKSSPCICWCLLRNVQFQSWWRVPNQQCMGSSVYEESLGPPPYLHASHVPNDGWGWRLPVDKLRILLFLYKS